MKNNQLGVTTMILATTPEKLEILKEAMDNGPVKTKDGYMAYAAFITYGEYFRVAPEINRSDLAFSTPGYAVFRIEENDILSTYMTQDEYMDYVKVPELVDPEDDYFDALEDQEQKEEASQMDRPFNEYEDIRELVAEGTPYAVFDIRVSLPAVRVTREKYYWITNKVVPLFPDQPMAEMGWMFQDESGLNWLPEDKFLASLS
jgi:hypothetical protein